MSKELDNKLKATLVKIYVSNIFKGTGFFITPQGHILTAHHVIDDYAGKQIKVVSQRHGEFRNVTLEKHKTCRSADLIILKINFDKDQLVLDCVPLSINLPEERVKLLGIGYPLGTEHPEMLKEAILEGQFIRCCNPQTFEVNNAIQGAGQSGGLIYNLETHRVIGVAKAIHDGNVMKNTGLASRLDELFNSWEELDDITKNVAQQWDQYLLKIKEKQKEIIHSFYMSLLEKILYWSIFSLLLYTSPFILKFVLRLFEDNNSINVLEYFICPSELLLISILSFGVSIKDSYRYNKNESKIIRYLIIIFLVIPCLFSILLLTKYYPFCGIQKTDLFPVSLMIFTFSLITSLFITVVLDDTL